MAYDYDLVAIGSGPAGQKAAIQAAKLGRRAAVVERRQLGGVSVNRGTIPSKTLREAIVYLTGLSQRDVYGESYRVKDDITPQDLAMRTRRVIEREIDIVRNQLTRNHVHLLQGTARFLDSHTIAFGAPTEQRISAEHIVVATGLALLAVGHLVLAWTTGLPPRESPDPKPILLILGGLAALVALIGLGGGFIPATAILFATTAAAFGRRAS